ncbi:MAG: hypothetical protein JWR11_782 [Mycobacterium sp.]|jgi:hypothetical protein|nr:hypothetical protein [Mycobacterium sp.]MDT5065971.1 hypothetical protein [Mycobacterium sp.]
MGGVGEGLSRRPAALVDPSRRPARLTVPWARVVVLTSTSWPIAFGSTESSRPSRTEATVGATGGKGQHLGAAGIEEEVDRTRRAGLLLRLPITVATRHQRKHQRTAS